MANNHTKKIIEQLLADAGVKLNGDEPWDIQVNSEAFYQRILANPELAIGETYMDGLWDCKRIDQLFAKLFHAHIDEKVKQLPNAWLVHGIARIKSLMQSMSNPQSIKRSPIVAKKHYDIGNDLFTIMLDKEMNYSCGYWRTATHLEQAQSHKLDLICRKLKLQAGQKILDIGCGWGAFARHAAQHYGVEVVGLTLSKQQYELAKTLNKELPITFYLKDYREFEGTFDHIVSIGMFEHVGNRNYADFFAIAKRCLNENGLFLLHTIGVNKPLLQINPWINKYIFPNGYLPSVKQIAQASEDYFTIEDWHNFGSDYDKTLMAWYHNVNQSWQTIAHQYDQRFKRMWDFYLLSTAGAFRQRSMQVWQIVFSKEGVPGGYRSIRK